MNVKPSDCIVFEDSIYGIEAAKKAGMFVLGHIDERFNYDQSKADYLFIDFMDAYYNIKMKEEN